MLRLWVIPGLPTDDFGGPVLKTPANAGEAGISQSPRI
jgi:hypothetical protein